MPTGFSRSPKLLKGALVMLGEGFLGPIPNIIVFQYNPEKLTRSFTTGTEKVKSEQDNGAVKTDEPFDPAESFNVTIEMDAADALEAPESHPIAAVFGVADRIAALEMLLYPTSSEAAVIQLSSLPGSNKEPVPKKKVPVLLFIWGPGRIVPVRITSFQVDEQAFSPSLYPIRASATLGLKVLKLESFPDDTKKRTLAEDIAVAAYKFTKGQKEVLARMNLINSADSILAMLPF
jgi:hypothetical protein